MAAPQRRLRAVLVAPLCAPPALFWAILFLFAPDLGNWAFVLVALAVLSAYSGAVALLIVRASPSVRAVAALLCFSAPVTTGLGYVLLAR